MGYERILHVVKASNYGPLSDGHIYTSLIATFDLGKSGFGSDAVDYLEHKSHKPGEPGLRSVPVYFYHHGDGNKEVKVDGYGQSMYLVDIKDVIEALEADVSRGLVYETLAPTLAFLKAFDYGTAPIFAVFEGS